MARVRAGTLSLLVAIAGCLYGGPGTGDEPALGDAEALAALDLALSDGHDHSDAALHPGAAWRMRDVWADYVPLDGAEPSPPSEFTLLGDLAFVSTFQPAAGFTILDISDPTHVTQVGRYDSGTAYVNDVEVTDDGRWAFLPTMPFETTDDTVEHYTSVPPVVGDYGVQVVDVSDPAAPRLAAMYDAPDPYGYHRLDILEIDGALHVFGASYGLGRVDILRFEDAPVPVLVPAGVYWAPEARDPRTTYGLGAGPQSNGVHDVTVLDDPLEGFPLLLVSHWRLGVHFVDVSDPSDPVLLGVWDDFVDVLPGNVHNVEMTLVEGRRMAVAVPEYPGGHERQGIHWIIDATDLENPVLHGTWSLPGEHPYSADEGTYVYSSDRTWLAAGLAFSAHFHAGLQVFDMSTLDKARAPELVGYIIPAAVEPVLYMGFTTNPLVYDAIPKGNHVFYTDLSGMFHVAEMDPEIVRGRVW